MKFETAKKNLTKRAENFYGISLEELIEFIDTHPQAESLSVMKAYDAYKQGLGLVWSGLLGNGWVERPKADLIYREYKSGQMEMDI